MKILIRGGSIAAGLGVAKNYADILKARYRRVRGLEIFNHSRPRDDSFDGVRTFPQDVEAYRPDVLLLHFGVDDAYLSVYRSEFKENLVQMVRKAERCFHPHIMLLTSHTFDDPNDMDVMNIYYRVVREVSVDLCCGMIPVHTFWKGFLEEGPFANRDLVQTDDRLPNDKGHGVFAAAIVRHLDTLIPGLVACDPGQTARPFNTQRSYD